MVGHGVKPDLRIGDPGAHARSPFGALQTRGGGPREQASAEDAAGVHVGNTARSEREFQVQWLRKFSLAGSRAGKRFFFRPAARRCFIRTDNQSERL
jgi:hypothetical protein